MRNLVQQLEKENWVCELWEKYFRDSFELIPKTHFSSPWVTLHHLQKRLQQPCWLRVPLPSPLSFSPISHFTVELVQSEHCRNNHQGSALLLISSRKWPRQLLAIQPKTLFGWPTLWLLEKKATLTAHFYFFLLVSLSAYFFPVLNIIYFSLHFRCMWGKKYCICLQNGKLDVSVAHVVSPHLKNFSLICQNCNHVKAM